MLIFICDDLPLKTCLSRKPQLCWQFCGLQPPCNLSHLRSLWYSAHYLWQPSSWYHCQLQRNHHYHLLSPHPLRWKHWRLGISSSAMFTAHPPLPFLKNFPPWVCWALAWQAFLFLWGILRCCEKWEELQNEQAKHLIFQTEIETVMWLFH